MNKPVYLCLSVLEIIKIVMYQFWYDSMRPKYVEKKKCYMHADSFIVYIKTEDIYADNGEDTETRFDTSNYELERPLPRGKN